ncbi:histidine phosphatase family protein [Streptomyces lunaelactis]|uniref:histidine phosphatase family protein n=1 Tax=Streptomyces lunaelactis TaxID=1535768 RepID=UPI0015848A36|nr:histidine phosphatase family protein [Streptomyces lunaelactis]NUK32295.1 histidine phosphatase family protein [Streptomyces lunaelactis]NUK41181.1 histidine phosphatase family protein [Streptomyces lunaelactis]
MTIFYLVQHAEKERQLGDPGLTVLGCQQAARTAKWLQHVGIGAVFSSPLRRARETAAFIADSCRLPVQEDARLRERMNWGDDEPIANFLADWAATVRDRDFVPRSGDSSRRAGARLLACLTDLAGDPGPVAVVTHGGVTVDLLRTLVGDEVLPDSLLHDGVPSCAITTLDGTAVVDIASQAHLQ